MTALNKKEIYALMKEIRKKEINKRNSTTSLGSKASSVEKVKYRICQNIIYFKEINGFSNSSLATLFRVDPSTVSRITHCHIHKFKLDSLLKYYEITLISLKNEEALRSFQSKLESLVDCELSQ